MVPRQPVRDPRRPFAQKRQGVGDLGLVRAHHPVGGKHPFRLRGRARRHQDLADRIRRDGGKSGINIRPGPRLQQIVKSRDIAPSPGPAGNNLDAVEHVQRQGFGILFSVDRVRHARTDQFHRMAEPVMGAVDQGILLGHGNDRRADILRGQGEQAVIHTGSGKHDDRRSRSHAARQQRRRQRPDLFQNGSKALSPPPGAAAFGDEDAVRRFGGPAMQPVSCPLDDRAEWIGRAQDDAAISTILPLGAVGQETGGALHFDPPPSPPCRITVIASATVARISGERLLNIRSSCRSTSAIAFSQSRLPARVTLSA